jgi:hypothetical protein
MNKHRTPDKPRTKAGNRYPQPITIQIKTVERTKGSVFMTLTQTVTQK